MLNDILYIESLGDYIKIMTHEDSIVSKSTITEFLELLPKDFVRIHRSYIVNSQHIKAYNKNEIHIQAKVLPIGISYKGEVNRYLNNLS